MKKIKLIALVAACCMAAAYQGIFAGEIPPANTMSVVQVLNNLQSKGYANVYKIEFEDGAYKVKMISTDGKVTELKLNPQTGAIIETKQETSNRKLPALSLTVLQAAQKVEAAGYHGVYKIKMESNEFEVEALDQNNKKVDLNVDGQSGKITKDWF
jgi:hypothetical protein